MSLCLTSFTPTAALSDGYESDSRIRTAGDNLQDEGLGLSSPNHGSIDSGYSKALLTHALCVSDDVGAATDDATRPLVRLRQAEDEVDRRWAFESDMFVFL